MPWMVTQGENQFSVSDLAALQRLAKKGELKAGDLLQPPGATDWLYAIEVEELATLVPEDVSEEDDYELNAYVNKKKRVAAMAAAAVGSVAMLLVVGGLIGAAILIPQLPSGDEKVLGGADGMGVDEMMVTEAGTGLRTDPDEKASVAIAVAQNSVLKLKGKRGMFYLADYKGSQGWIRIDEVVPAYILMGKDVKAKMDPLYNPDRYVQVANASWTQQLEDPKKAKKRNVDPDAKPETIFQFMFRNESHLDMTDLNIILTVKDAQGQVLETVEVPVEGIIPKNGSTWVGTVLNYTEDARGRREVLAPDEPERRLLTEYSKGLLAEEDGEIELRYIPGIRVEMETTNVVKAEINVVQLRALPE